MPSSNTLATWCEGLTHWKRPWCWERLRAGGEGDDRGWDGWMASPTRWTWVCTSSGSWWWTGRPGMLQSMGSQRVGHDWAAEQQQSIPGIWARVPPQALFVVAPWIGLLDLVNKNTACSNKFDWLSDIFCFCICLGYYMRHTKEKNMLFSRKLNLIWHHVFYLATYPWSIVCFCPFEVRRGL